MFEDETQVSLCCVNQFPHHARFVVSQKSLDVMVPEHCNGSTLKEAQPYEDRN
jgi:hypothetical protein